ncbi:MAG: glycosyltransferase family 1 protein [Lachnospiraceae bacterium]|nr:glycosyltransferase family 1 protein [Lachnospiraceae bacterium]
MEGQIRILHVLGRLDRGGAETMVMNLYRHMDRNRIQFDFVIHTEDVCDYTEEVKRLGGKIYSMKPFRASTAARYCGQWRRFFERHPEYRVVHGHMRSTASLYLREAKKAGLVTIAHSHNTSSGKGFSALVKNILQYPLRFQADYLFACSRGAGVWLYGKRACKGIKFHLLLNGIEPEAFRFDARRREEKRREMTAPKDSGRAGAGDMQSPGEAPVFLHIGRMETQKNHAFLLRIMKEVVNGCPQARLWLCGVGPLEDELKKQVGTLGIETQVRFLGMRTDVPELMQAADGVIFPSLFEGLPVTLIEAQAAGLPVLMSDTITEEVILTGLVRTMPLSETPGTWAEEALRMTGGGELGDALRVAEDGKTDAALRNAEGGRREAYADVIGRSGYDVAENAKKLERFYEDAVLRRAGGEKRDRKS